MNKYKVFKIVDSQGSSVGKQEYYTTLGKAKCGARHCIWRLDPGSKIIELEVSEVPISEVEIIMKTERKKNWTGEFYNDNTISGFSDQENTNKKEEVPSTEKIIFS